MLKYYSRLNIFKNSTGTCSWDGVTGKSYKSTVVALIDGVYYCASYEHNSVTTKKHTREIQYLISEQCVDVPVSSVACPGEIAYQLTKRLSDLNARINKKRIHKKTRERVEKEIETVTELRDRMLAIKAKEEAVA